MAENNPYDFRGFKVYTPELPDAPATPLYGIVFWLSGAEDEDTGLLRCDHYNGYDYTNGDWPRVYNYNTTFTNKPLDFVGDDEIDLSIPGWGLAFDNVGLSVGDGFSIGFKATIDSVYYAGKRAVFAGFSVGFGYIGSDLQLMVGTTYNEKVFPQLSDAIYSASYFNQGTEYYYQLSYWSATNIAKIYVNGVEVLSQEVSAISELRGFQLLAYYHALSGWTVTKLLSGVAVSSDPDLMMYTTEYNGVKLNDLTEYPKLVVPSITTHPQSEEVLTGAPFAELSVVYLDGGETCTLQWQSYSGSAWSDIEGEETDAYTPTTAGTYRVGVTNSKGTTYSNSAVLTETEEIDYMEYATNGAAQAAYVTSDDEVLQSYAEGTIKTQGNYALKGVATTDAVSADPDVAVLLHCNGTDESQTITDESGKTWTAAGTAQIDTSEKKFGTGSLLLDGNSDYISTPDHADFNFGSGDFTIEFWVRYNTVQQSVFFSQYPASGYEKYIYCYLTSANKLHFNAYSSGELARYDTPALTINTGQWYHFAFVRNGSSFYIFVDGVSQELTVTTAIGTNTMPDVDYTVTFGADIYNGNAENFINGRVEEIRISKGVARYTENFTPSTSEFSINVNAKLTKTFSPALNLTGIDYANFNLRSSRTGENIKIGLHDTGGTTTEITPNITDADTFQNVEWDLSGVSDANKNAVDTLTITIVNADSANTFYIDAFEVGAGDGVAEGEILFGTHFDDESDWNTSQDASLLNDWDQKTADNEGGGTYEAGYIAQHGESSGKCLKQYWDTGTSTAQNCWLIKNSISIPDEFWLGYRFKVDTNWDWGSATSLKIMKLHYDNGTTLDINWCSSHYEMPSPYTPPGGGYSIATDATGKNWFGHWTDIDDGAWHTFVWHFKHSTNTLECFIDSVDAALTSETPAFPGSGWDDGSESGYALSFGGNLSGGGGGVDEMYTKYDDICLATTRAKVEEFLGI